LMGNVLDVRVGRETKGFKKFDKDRIPRDVEKLEPCSLTIITKGEKEDRLV
jgi:hypothetical protein